MLSCASPKLCKTSGDCLHGQYCETSSGLCKAGCNESSECDPGFVCNAATHQCKATICPNKKEAVDGKCTCEQQADCPAATYCKKEGEQGLCLPLCIPGGASPEDGKCSCPPSWEWAKGQCRKQCPSSWGRDSEGLCVLDLAAKAPDYFENDEKGKLRFKCPQGFVRNSKGSCEIDHSKLPKAPTSPPVPNIKLQVPEKPSAIPAFQGGPNKPCPSTQDKWDTDYIKRNNLPSTTIVRYIDASASTGGDGSQSKPFSSIQDALQNAVDGSVLLLAPGQYKWGLTIEHALHLVGRCTNGVKLEVTQGATGPAVTLKKAGVVLEGLSIVGGSTPPGVGIRASKLQGTFTIRHLHIKAAKGSGVWLEGGGLNLAFSRIEEVSGNGVFGRKPTASVSVTDSYLLKNSQNGLYLDDSQNVEVLRNKMESNGTKDNQYGLVLIDTQGTITLRHNHALKNADYGVALSGTKNVLVEANQFTANGFKNTSAMTSGLFVERSKGLVTVRGNYTQENKGCGILLQYLENLTVENNWIERNLASTIPEAGLVIAQSTGTIKVLRNHIRSQPTQGFYSTGGSKTIEFSNNVIANNGAIGFKHGVGARFRKTPGVLLSGNIVENNHPQGIALFFLPSATVRNNLFKGNGNTSINGQISLGLLFDNIQNSITIENNEFTQNYNFAIYLNKAKQATLKSNLFQETVLSKGRSPTGVTIRDVTDSTLVQGNHFLKHPQWALTLVRLNKVTLKNNVWKGNGGLTSPVGSGSVYAYNTQQVDVEQNIFQENPGNPVYLHNVSQSVLVENLLQNNSSKAKKPRGLYVWGESKAQAQATFRHNRIFNQTGYGIAMLKGKEAIVERNVVRENKVSEARSAVVYAGQVSETIRVHHNHLTQGYLGIHLEDSNRAEVTSNLVEEMSDPGVSGLRIADLLLASNVVQASKVGIVLGVINRLKYKLKIKGNLIQNNKEDGVLLGTHFSTDIEGNAFLNNGPSTLPKRNDSAVGSGLKIASHGSLSLLHNLFQGNASFGIILGDGETAFSTKPEENPLLIEDNIVQNNDSTNSGAYGLLLSAGHRQIQLRRNDFRNNYQGALIDRLGTTTSLLVTENLWVRNRNMGLMFAQNRATVTIKDDSFVENGGTQIAFQNSDTTIKIHQCGFSTAKASKGLSKDHVGLSGREYFQSSGIGIWAGAIGLVRWVFAKDAEYPCSPSATKQVPAVPGMTLRAVRVPWQFDPCIKRVYSATYRTDTQRKAASLCQTCYQRTDGKTGCRWLWEEAGIGANKGQGLWAPTEKVECVAPSEVDTCNNPPQSTSPDIQTVKHLKFVLGQCLPLATGQKDPCIGQEAKACSARKGDGAPWRCERFDSNGTLLSGCFPNDFALKVCRNAPPCPEGLYCTTFQNIRIAKDIRPPGLQVENNVFWGNEGPDIQLDMAGNVTLQNNIYLACKHGSRSCPRKSAFRRIGTKGEWKKVDLPQSTTILWQKPSPFEEPFHSTLSGNDLFLKSDGLPLLFRPDLCQSFSTQ